MTHEKTPDRLPGRLPEQLPESLPGLALSRAVVDRDAVRRTQDGWLREAWSARGTAVVRVRRGRVAVVGDPPVLDLSERPDVPEEDRFYLGTAAGVAYFAAVVGNEGDGGAGGDGRDVAPFLGLRAALAVLDGRDAGLAVHAVSLANWHATHTHCPRCGAPTTPASAGHLRRCVADGSEHYPRTDPAVIMSVVDASDRLLLGRQSSWGRGNLSTLAGFVEPGESLEAAVRREVHEEVGIAVGEVHYLGSQPHPFPSSLMVGFRAHASSTEIVLHDGEIAEARWFTRAGLVEAIRAGELLATPTISISRRLIEHWYGERLPTGQG